jgi:hypothetical protein
MQDAHVRSGNPESRALAKLLESVSGLNRQFLDLVSAHSTDWGPSRVGLAVELSGKIAPLTAAQKRAASNCPYALFDLRFDDEHHWQSRLGDVGQWSVADVDLVDPDTAKFVNLALFFAWHSASTGKLPARLLLGMSEATATIFRSVTLDRLLGLGTAEAVHLTARWCNRSTYWNALAAAAARPNSAALRRIQLSGLQLTAAARLV